MKIYSWNVNGIRAVDKKGALSNFFETENPDIVCFQEIKIDKSQVEKENFGQKYPDYLKFYSHAERKGYAGTAIWSKISPKQILLNFPVEIKNKFNLADNFGDATTEGRICAAEFEDFWLLTVYTPNTKNDLGRLSLRKNWDGAFLEFAKGLRDGKFSNKSFEDDHVINTSEKTIENFKAKPVVFCGDLNVAHEEIDLSNPKQNKGKHGFTDEERYGFSEFINAGFKDIFRDQNPNIPELYTWWSHFAKSRERNVGWRIDYFLESNKDGSITLDKQKVEHVKARIHPEILGSDHCPISIEFLLTKNENKHV